MLRRQLRVKNMIYTSLFDSCANCPYPEKGLSGALRLREKLAEKQVILNEINYNSMIKGKTISFVSINILNEINYNSMIKGKTISFVSINILNEINYNSMIKGKTISSVSINILNEINYNSMIKGKTISFVSII